MKSHTLLLASLPVLSLLLSTQAHATPHAGSKELRIGQEFQPPVNLSNGFIHLSPEKGDDGITALGLGGGFGYFLNDAIELGLSANIQMLKSGGSTMTGPGFAPFLRFMGFQGKLGYFLEVDAAIQRFSSDSSDAGQTMFSIGGDLGLEFFVTDDWAVRLAPTFRHLVVSRSGGGGPDAEATGNRYGITWGLACYF